MTSRLGSWVLRNLFLLGTAVFMLAPFAWMISLSIKSPGEIFQQDLSFWPEHFYGVENYREALTRTPMFRYLLNGGFVAITVAALQIAVAAPMAYALAKLRFPGRNFLFALVLIGLLVPQEVLGLPLFIMFAYAGILNSYTSLILPFIISPFGIFLFRQFFKSVPDDLIHAARLDGLSEFSIVWRIMIPAAIPALVAFVILSLVSRWNNLFWPLIAIQSQDLMPPSLGIVFFRNEEAGSDFGPLMAAATIVVTPLILAFLLAQRRFVEGMTMSGMK